MPVRPADQSTPSRPHHRAGRRRGLQAVAFGIVLLVAACASPTEPRAPRATTPSFDGGTPPADSTTGRSNYSLPHG